MNMTLARPYGRLPVQVTSDCTKIKIFSIL
jgi:hypothetical protein